jgi:FixJ family two-component response regulator
MRGDHIVYVVDDDPAIREALDDLLRSLGFRVATFESARDYLALQKADVPTCLILDVQLKDGNGLDLQQRLASEDAPPIVFISGHGDVPCSVRAMKAGAFDFLPKPFSPVKLVAAVDAALLRHRQVREVSAVRARLLQRYASLPGRERDTLQLVVSGFLNKQAAARLDISVVTLQIYRGNVMRKMGARSLADLVRMAAALKIPEVDRRTHVTPLVAKPAPSRPSAIRQNV